MKTHAKRGSSNIQPTLKEGGEIIYDIVPNIYVTKHEPGSFVRVFHNPFLKDLKGHDALLLWRLKDFLTWGDPHILLSKYHKDRIVMEFKWSLSTVDRAIANLRRLNILIRIDGQSKKSALYMINPEIMWFGDENSRKKKLNEYLTNEFVKNMPDREKDAIAGAKKYKQAFVDTSVQLSKSAQESKKPSFDFNNIIAAKDEENIQQFFQHFTKKDTSLRA